MRIATWNVNSLRVRLPQVLDWLAAQSSNGGIDALGLQETKLTDEAFPVAEFAAAGWNCAFSGQKTYNGVAILSRHALTEVSRDLPGFADEQKRVIAATVATPSGPLRFVNVYVVNGQSLDSEKYQYKLRFLAALRDYLRDELARYPRLAVGGDYNIAPTPADTHDPTLWLVRAHIASKDRLIRIKTPAEIFHHRIKLFTRALRRLPFSLPLGI